MVAPTHSALVRFSTRTAIRPVHTSMKPPRYLDKEAKAFWTRHAPHCVENGTLTEITADSFALVCRFWSLMASTDPHEDSKAAMKFNGLAKHYMALAKPFGLLGSKGPEAKTDITDVLKKLKGG